MYEPSFLYVRASLVDARFLKAGIALSLLLHLALLAIPAKKPSAEGVVGQRLTATLARLPAHTLSVPAMARPASPPPRREVRPQRDQRILSMAKPDAGQKAPIMPAAPAHPPEQPRPAGASANLAMNALAMAREFGRRGGLQNQWDGDAIERLPDSPEPDTIGIELYFDALVKKLNRSAAFAPNQQRRLGAGTAALRVKLNPDGSLQGVQVINVADQAEEIEYIKSVVALAAPFPAFPADLKRSVRSVSMLICVKPQRDGAGLGFSRDGSGRRGC